MAGKLQTGTCQIGTAEDIRGGTNNCHGDRIVRQMTDSRKPTAQVATPPARGRAGTGIAGLDDTLAGGLPQYRVYVIEGDPGAGKTTLALQFLLEGSRLGETVLYVTLSETAEELIEVARVAWMVAR